MRLILVRHGETEENKAKIFQGHIHGTLSKEGKWQAEKLALRLANEKFDVIIASDLKRAADTAKAIAKYHKGVPLIFTKQARERDYGTLTGKRREDYPEFNADSPLIKVTKRPKRGESIVDLRKRIVTFWKQLRKQYYGKKILIVAHGSFNRQLIGYLMNKSVKESCTLKQGNTAVNIVEIDESGKHKVHLIGCVRHL